jgi:hypothetical protein
MIRPAPARGSSRAARSTMISSGVFITKSILGGEHGWSGDLDAFAAKLREVLARG